MKIKGIFTSKAHNKIKRILEKIIKRRIEIKFETKNMFPAHFAIEEGYIYYSSPLSAEHPLEDWSIGELVKGLFYLLKCLFFGKIRIY